MKTLVALTLAATAAGSIAHAASQSSFTGTYAFSFSTTPGQELFFTFTPTDTPFDQAIGAASGMATALSNVSPNSGVTSGISPVGAIGDGEVTGLSTATDGFGEANADITGLIAFENLGNQVENVLLTANYALTVGAASTPQPGDLAQASLLFEIFDQAGNNVFSDGVGAFADETTDVETRATNGAPQFTFQVLPGTTVAYSFVLDGDSSATATGDVPPPIPLPAGMTLLLPALGALAWFRRRAA